MTHVYEEKKVVKTTVKPSEVYKYYYVADKVKEIIVREQPLAFRPPKVGDRYIMNNGTIENAPSNFQPWEPRFILSKEPVPIESIWE